MIDLINYSFWGQDNLGTGLLIQNQNLVANAPWDTFPYPYGNLNCTDYSATLKYTSLMCQNYNKAF